MSSTTFRKKGGGARVSVELSAETMRALGYLEKAGATKREAINQAVMAAAREAWEENERQAREDAR